MGAIRNNKGNSLRGIGATGLEIPNAVSELASVFVLVLKEVIQCCFTVSQRVNVENIPSFKCYLCNIDPVCYINYPTDRKGRGHSDKSKPDLD